MMGISHFTFLVIIVFVTINGINIVTASSNNETLSIWNDTHTDILKRDLLVNYDKFSRPYVDGSPTEINTGLAIKHVELNEEEGIFSVYGWIRMSWRDPKLKWNPDEYGNVSSINFAGHEIWEPELIPLNSATINSFEHYGDTMMIAYRDGNILRVPPFQFNVFCGLNFHLWPYDIQKCQLDLGTWDSQDVQIKIKDFYNEIDRFIENNEWHIKNISHGIGTDKEYNIEYITFDFEIERRSSMYRAVIITPASCIIITILATFWLPPQCGEKIILNGFNGIIISGFLLYFAQMLPILSQHTPLVVLFFSSTLVLVAISTIISVLVIYMATGKHQRRVPQSIRNLLNGNVIGTIFCLKLLNTTTSSAGGGESDHHDQQQTGGDKELQENNGSLEDQQIIQQIVDNSSCIKLRSFQHDWVLLATAIDRFFFYIYCIVFIILAISYSV